MGFIKSKTRKGIIMGVIGWVIVGVEVIIIAAIKIILVPKALKKRREAREHDHEATT